MGLGATPLVRLGAAGRADRGRGRWRGSHLRWPASPDCTQPLLRSESGRCSVSDSLQPHGLFSPWNSPDQNTGVGSLSLLQGFFPTQGLNPGLLHCRQILYQLSYQGSSMCNKTQLNDLKPYCVCHPQGSNKRNGRDKGPPGQSKTFTKHAEWVLNHTVS